MVPREPAKRAEGGLSKVRMRSGFARDATDLFGQPNILEDTIYTTFEFFAGDLTALKGRALNGE